MSQGQKTLVVGFNHNIKYRGQTYHAQTEDTGAPRCQVVTHLFLGGNIVASKRTGYTDLAGAENLAEIVRGLMEGQHKEVLRNLVHGVYDRVAPGAVVPSPVGAEGLEEVAPPARNLLFAHDLITERSLDEVILAYLAGETVDRGR